MNFSKRLNLHPFYIKSIGFFLGILLFLIVWFFVDFGAEFHKAKLVAAVASLMAT